MISWTYPVGATYLPWRDTPGARRPAGRAKTETRAARSAPEGPGPASGRPEPPPGTARTSTSGGPDPAGRDTASGGGRPADDRDGGHASRRQSSAALAERVAEVAVTCPDVLRLTAGPRGRIATYRAGRPLAGVAVRDGEVEVGVVVRYGRSCVEIAEDVRRLVRPLAGPRLVDVLIGDLADDG